MLYHNAEINYMLSLDKACQWSAACHGEMQTRCKSPNAQNKILVWAFG